MNDNVGNLSHKNAKKWKYLVKLKAHTNTAKFTQTDFGILSLFGKPFVSSTESVDVSFNTRFIRMNTIHNQ